MEKLFTIDEYRKKIIKVATKTAKQSIKKNANPIIKRAFVNHIVEECLTYHFMLKDEFNFLFFEVFGYDRQGNNLVDTTTNFSEEECAEFNSQKWYADYNQENPYHPKNFDNHYIYNGEKKLINYEFIKIADIIVEPFIDKIYEMTNEVLDNLA